MFPANTSIVLESDPESDDEDGSGSDEDLARGDAAAGVVGLRGGGGRGASSRKGRASTSRRLGTALRGARGKVNPAALIFGENMSIDARLRMLGEKPYGMPKYKTPRELHYAVNELVNDSDAIGDHEARVLTRENTRRLAAIEAKMDFEDISEASIARVTHKMQSRMLFPEAKDPMMRAFKEEVKVAAAAKKEKKTRKIEEAEEKASKAGSDVVALLKDLIGEIRGERDGGRFEKRRKGWVELSQLAQVLHLRQARSGTCPRTARPAATAPTSSPPTMTAPAKV